jgi:pyruvate kinase
VIRADENEILCSADVGGVISDRKGVNVPDAVVPVPALTEKDRRDLAFAMSMARTGSACPSCSGPRTWPRPAS